MGLDVSVLEQHDVLIQNGLSVSHDGYFRGLTAPCRKNFVRYLPMLECRGRMVHNQRQVRWLYLYLIHNNV